VQQGLTLTRAAEYVAGLAVFLELTYVTADRFPTSDLAAVFVRHAAAHIVTAMPLQPAARVIFVEPSFALPFRQRLAGIDAEKVKRDVVFAGRYVSIVA
jgi:hypothetical protein